MEVEKTTSELMIYKTLNRDIEKAWVTWAIDMLMSGYETEHLNILAGKAEPFNPFEMEKLVNKVFIELKIDYSYTEQRFKNYACYLIDKSLNGEVDNFNALDLLRKLFLDTEEDHLYDFYLLFFAKYDLTNSEVQWYWEGAGRGNIDQIITDYFIKYITQYKINCVLDKR